MSDKHPLVSIIIPSYNQGDYIRKTIESCLMQDYRPIEIIVIDGASTDDTIKILQEYDTVPEVRWISEPDHGVAEAVNKGFAVAKGEIAGIQSSDDAYLEGAVSQAVEQFIISPDLGLVYADCVNVNLEGEELSCFKSSPFTLENFLCKSTLILQPAAFFKLALARSLGGWNAEYFNCDTEMWFRMVFQAPAKKVDRVWGQRLIHDEQRNVQGKEIVESTCRMIQKSPHITNASRRLQRAATCGRFMTNAVYGSHRRLLRRYYYWRAFLSFPDILKKRPKLIGQLIPYYWVMYKWRVRFRSIVGRVIRSL